MSVKTIRKALADAVGKVSGIQTTPYILSSYTAPAAMVYGGEVTFDLSMGRGTDERKFVVRVVVPFTSDIGSQTLLDEFRDGAGARSFKAALEADDTLGGACQRLRVVSVGPDTVYGTSQGQVIGIGCEFQIDLLASGTS